MPTIKLNRRNVAGLQAGAAAAVWFDTDLKGFGLRIMPTGARSWIVEYRPGAGGRGVAKKRVKVGGPELSPEQAREAAEKLLAAVSLGGDPAAARAAERESLSVKDMLDEYLKRHVRPKRKAATVDFYERSIRVHLVPALGSKRAGQMTRSDVAKMHTDVADKARGGGRFAANRALAILSAAYGWAGLSGLVPDGFNPATRIEKFVEEARERYLTTEEIERLGAALAEAETVGIPYEVAEGGAKAKHAAKPENRRTVFSPHVTGAVRLLMLTGARLREILHLRWSEVDRERALLYLPDSKTGRKVVVLSGAALAVLDALPRVGVYVIASSSAGLEDERPRTDLKKPWAAISARAGLPGLRLHDLRHTFASVGAGSGLGLPVVGALLGHSQPSTTQRYAHVANDPVRAAADLVANRIATAMKGTR
ncbi:tyrosine-type recombinase/integrase [Xanthobacteraceae bacterium A53D]